MKKKVLFICIHNSARSQMAEEYLRLLDGDKYETESAGYKPEGINPLVIKVMKEEGIDLSNKRTQDIFDLVRASKFFGYVITVCERAKEEECPIFPGVPKRLYWNLENPEYFTGTEEEKTEKVRALRDKIKSLVTEFIREDV
jgi:arsenate reductase (thioredoxin)